MTDEEEEEEEEEEELLDEVSLMSISGTTDVCLAAQVCRGRGRRGGPRGLCDRRRLASLTVTGPL